MRERGGITGVCGGAPPGCDNGAQRGVAHGHRGTRCYAPSSRLPVAGIYVLMAAVCARTRVPIAILSGVVHITPAKVLLSFSRVRSRLSHREEEY